jgi:diacylglycerol kinase
MILGLIDALGYAASGLTLATFAQQAMRPMRIMAIGANLCFIGYGAMGHFMPVLVLHIILLPINLARLRMLIREHDHERARPHEKAADAPAVAGLTSGLL